jgi:hypothetical protein
VSLAPEFGDAAESADVAPLRFVSAAEFASISEPSADPLLGTSEATVLSVGGDLITYGAGGSGKTTLALDGVVHLAAGVEWIGLDVPRRITITVLENEGPRGKFRQKLKRKLEAWAEHDLAIYVLDEPWAQFTFNDERHRSQLAEHLNATGSDLLVCGPISTLGMVGGGTPDEINAFVGLTSAMRQLVRGRLALWLIHHENRAGQVSGAWERVPDTLVHVTPHGNGHTRIYWQKVRWSSELHATTTHGPRVKASRSRKPPNRRRPNASGTRSQPSSSPTVVAPGTPSMVPRASRGRPRSSGRRAAACSPKACS